MSDAPTNPITNEVNSTAVNSDTPANEMSAASFEEDTTVNRSDDNTTAETSASNTHTNAACNQTAEKQPLATPKRQQQPKSITPEMLKPYPKKQPDPPGPTKPKRGGPKKQKSEVSYYHLIF